MRFQGLEIRPFSQVTALRPVRIDRLRVEVRRTLFGEIEYDLVGTMGGGGEGFPVCRPFERLEDVWPEKDKLEAAIQAARWMIHMDRKKETVIYRHPQGRYEVVEISGTDLFGGTYRYRETRRTPKRDARGLLRDEDLCAPAIRLTGAEQAEVGETARRKERIQYKGGARRPVTGAERAEICRLWEQGEPVRGYCRTDRTRGRHGSASHSERGGAAGQEKAPALDAGGAAQDVGHAPARLYDAADRGRAGPDGERDILRKKKGQRRLTKDRQPPLPERG